jgi:hypothetical protein
MTLRASNSLILKSLDTIHIQSLKWIWLFKATTFHLKENLILHFILF